MSKQPKPSASELEFIYSLILEGYRDDDILDRYSNQATFPCRTDKRFLRERRKELDAAEAALKDRIEKKVNPIIVQRKQEHFQHLADIADILLSGGLDKVPEGEDEDEDETAFKDGEAETDGDRNLVGRLDSNIHAAIIRYNQWEVITCFFTHLEGEDKRIEEDFIKFYEEYPVEMIEILRLVSQRKTFKGTCPVCAEW